MANTILKALLEITIYSIVIFLTILLIKKAFHSRMSFMMHYCVWFILVLRLVVPVTIETSFNFVNLPMHELLEAVSMDNAEMQTEHQGSGAWLPERNKGASIVTPPKERENYSVSAFDGISWQVGLLSLFAGVAAIMILRMFALHTHLLLHIRKNSNIPNAPTLEKFEIWKNRLRIRSPINLVVYGDNKITTPALIAAVPPIIVLPENTIMKLDDHQLDLCICHELSHYKFKDHIMNLLLSLLSCIYWFNPIIYLAKKMILRDMELRCDHSTLSQFSAADKRLYANTLLSLGIGKHKIHALGMSSSTGKKALEERIVGIFSAPNSSGFVRMLAILIFTILLLTCFTTACQPTPESPVIHSKGDIMDSIINGSELTATVPNIASKYEYKLLGNVKDSLRINDCAVDISAEIIAPNITECAAVKLKSYYYTEKDLEKFIGLFFEPSTALNYTNDTAESVEREILYYKKLIADLNSGNLPGDDLRSIDEQISDCEIQIVELEKKLLNLDEDSNNELSISFEKFTSVETLAQFIGKCNAKDYILEVCNMQDYGSSLIFYYKGFVKTVPVDNIAESDEPDLAASLSVADSYMEPLGIQDYVLYSKSVMDLKTIDSTNATTYVYNLQFVRSYNGSIAPSLIAPAPAGMSTTNANKEQYGRCANPEVLKVITDGKEVFWFEWTNPYVIEGTVNSNVSVINQDEAMTIALSHLKNLLVEKEATKLFINRIELNGSYITIKDERDTFLLIPVWDIIGYQTLHDGSRYLGSPEYALSYVTINAVDGSIIDRNLGY